MKRATQHLVLSSLLVSLTSACVADRTGGAEVPAGGSDAATLDANVSKDTGPSGALDGGLPSDTETTTVAQLQEEAEAIGCTESQIETLQQSVALSGVVVTVPKFDAFTPDDGSGGLDGYFVADVGGEAWSGIMIVVERSEGTDFAVGDLLDITGELEEFYCLTQLEVLGYAVTGSSAEEPTPLTVSPAEAGAEPYESVLLAVEGVTVESMDDYGNFTVTDGLIVGDYFKLYPALEVGKTYDVTGVIVMSYGEYRLAPRTLGDIIDLETGQPLGPSSGPTDPVDPPGPTGGVTEISALQQSADAMSCESAIVNGASGYILEGTIAVGSFEVYENLNAYLISDGSGEPWSGINIVVEKSADEGWSVGQTVRVTGDHVEFYCATQLDVTDIEVLGEVQPPTPIALPDETLDMEPWEGVVVTVENVMVTGIDDFESYGEVSVSLDAGVTSAPFIIDDWIMGSGAMSAPQVGNSWSSVTGAITYDYGEYRLAPLNAASMVSAQ